MREAAGKFAPGGDPFGLHQLFFLSGQGAGHVVEGSGELANFIAAMNVNARVPASRSDLAGSVREFFDGAGDARGDPPRHEEAGEEGSEGYQARGFQDLAAEENQFALRAAEKQNAQQFLVAAGKRYGVKGLRAGGIVGPLNGFYDHVRLH